MTKKTEVSISLKEKLSRIYTPINIYKEPNISGCVFFDKLLKKTKLKKLCIHNT